MKACVEFTRTIFPKPAAFFEPSERAFDDPAFGDDGEGMKFAAFGDFNGGTKNVFCACGEGFACITAIDENMDNVDQIAFI